MTLVAPLYSLLLLLHLLGVTAWVGGMFFAHFALRPSAAEVLEPPLRLPLLVAVFRRFFRFAAVAVLLVLLSGLGMMAAVGAKAAPVGWHLMAGLGFVMAAVFGYIYGVLYPRLRALAAARAWPEAAKALAPIRQLVAFNLALGVCTIVIAAVSR